MKYRYLMIFLLLTTIALGQKNVKDKVKNKGDQIRNAQILIVKIDSTYFQIDSLSRNQINHKWIKRIEILKNKDYSNIFGNPRNSTILIYPKKRFKRKMLFLLEKHKTLNID